MAITSEQLRDLAAALRTDGGTVEIALIKAGIVVSNEPWQTSKSMPEEERRQLRMECLKLAIEACAAQASADDIHATAMQFYAFVANGIARWGEAVEARR